MRLSALSAGGAVVCALLLVVGMISVLRDMPLGKREQINAPRLLIEAANGEPLGRVGPYGDPVDHKDFPDQLVKAVLSVEDRRFYQHWGVDVRAVVRALRANWKAGETVQGGSTITQQLAKLQLVGDERTFLRKLREALAALWLEQRLTKSEILGRYLNSVYLGRGAYGMSAAARIYFDKSLPELSLAQTALLAGMIQAPSRYDLGRNLDGAHRRAATVLHAMVETGAIDRKSAEQAEAQPAMFKGSSSPTSLAHSWFADWIASHEYPKLVGSQDRVMRIRTTLQPELQELADRIITEVLKREGPTRGVAQGALVAMRPDGAVVAMVGGRDYNESQFNRAVDAKRQPGSAFKLFVYFAALQNGYSPDDEIDASPIKVGRWEPENYGGRQHGRMTLSQSFTHSVNTAAVRLAMTVGLDEVIAAARKLGLDAPLSEVPSMALGTNEVNLLNLTSCFAAVRAGRPKLEPWGIAAFGVEGRGLRSLGPPASSGQALPHQQELTSLLRAAVNHGTGRTAALDDDDDAAGKTGTSQDYRDAWFVGFNKALVVGVWVGNDDRSSMKGVTGGSLSAEIWKRFVMAAKPLLDHLDKPATGEVQMESGTAKQSQCDQATCAATYQSFRSSDCTYQPYSGPRRLCDKGNSQLIAGYGSGNSSLGTELGDRQYSSGSRSAKVTTRSVAPVAERRASSYRPAIFENLDRY